MKFHKKFHVVALLAAILALNAQAAEVSSVQVKRAVSAWAAANGSAFANPGSVTGATPVAENGTNLYWIVTMSNGGAVIASPDTDLDLVIAVLEKSDGTFPAGHPLPSILRKDMKNRLSIIRSGSTSSSSSSNSGVRMASMLNATTQSTAAELPEDVKASVEKANAQWAKYGNPNAGVSLLGASLTDGDASPYVRRIVDGFETGGRFTHWNQSASPVDGKPLYNLYTPNNAVCGCVATAGSAIMQFFGCTNDVGEVDGVGCTYDSKPYSCKTLPGSFDWSIFPTNSLASVNDFAATNEVARDMIGRVAYNLGVLVGMAWNDGESGAQTARLADAFKSCGFKYAKSVEFAEKAEGTAPYFRAIYAQNWAGAPVVMSIRGDIGGHAVVACGYAKDGDGDEFCRVFMGWGGSGDFWYKFPDVGSFNTINGAVTMLGYQQNAAVEGVPAGMGYDSGVGIPSDSVVPVCGKANVTNTTLVIPGGSYKVVVDIDAMEKELVPVDLVVPVDENGFFATRIPISMKSPTLVHPGTGSSMTIAPFNKTAIDKASTSVDLDKALPGELLFLALNMTVKPTVESARATASEEGKALLMISGSGSVRENMLIDYITYLDSTYDCMTNFVLVRVNSADTSLISGDGDPTIGVFNPDDHSEELRWWAENGRLAYENFIDYNADNSENVNYTFTADNAVNLTNSVNDVLSIGLDANNRIHSGISVEVDSIDLSSMESLSIDAVEPLAGTYAECWTNGEEVVFSAPALYTNFTEGVVYSCLGYATNGVVAGEDTTTATIKLSKGDQLSFMWLWEPSQYQVSASVLGLPSNGRPDDIVTPENTWIDAGARVTLKAMKALGDYKFKEWIVSRKCAVELGDYETSYMLNDYNPLLKRNGAALSFTVFEPVVVTANYSLDATGGIVDGEEKKYSVEIVCEPSELAAVVSLKGGMKWGVNEDLIDSVAYLAPAATEYGVSATSRWVCVGWEVNGAMRDPYAMVALSSTESTVAKCIWEMEYDIIDAGTGGTDDPVDPPSVTPNPIAFSSISQGANGVWTLTLTNAVKDCWYHLEYTDSLSPVNWMPVISVQATQDGPITFQEAGNATGGGRFWRARATSTETGN